MNQVPLQVIKQMAGHSSITTTEQYTHALPAESSKMIQKYWNSIYRFEDKPSPRKAPKPVMVIKEGATPKLGEQAIQIDSDYRFDLDVWLANQSSKGITIDATKLKAGDPDAVKFKN